MFVSAKVLSLIEEIKERFNVDQSRSNREVMKECENNLDLAASLKRLVC